MIDNRPPDETSQLTTLLLPVSEIYGLTFQGEIQIGMPIVVLRTWGCNLKCVWCDSRYAWDADFIDPKIAIKRIAINQVAEQIRSLGGGVVKNLMITGGEPLLHRVALLNLISLLHDWSFYIETAGTLLPLDQRPWYPGTQRVHYNVSPKLANSENLVMLRRKGAALAALQATGRASWKFVVRDLSDLAEVDLLVKEYGLSPVYLMPEGIDRETILNRSAAIAEAAIVRGYHFTTRLHILTYGNERGR